MKRIFTIVIIFFIIILSIGYYYNAKYMKYNKIDNIAQCNILEVMSNEIVKKVITTEKVFDITISELDRISENMELSNKEFTINLYDDATYLDSLVIYSIKCDVTNEILSELVYIDGEENKYVACLEYNYFGSKKIVVDIYDEIWIELVESDLF